MDIPNIEHLIGSKSLKLAVFGLGRIGLPTALMFCQAGFHVYGVDINPQLVENLNKELTFIDEPGLPALLHSALTKNLIEFTLDYKKALFHSNIVVICVPTPVTTEKMPNYTAIKDVSMKIGQNLRNDMIIINESSVSPTTIRDIIIPILEKESSLKLNHDFGVCSCPERADPGKIVENFQKVARIVGGSSPEIGEIIVKLYQSITKANIVQVSTPGTANAVKLTENIFRDVNIALMNEFAVLYERLGIDIKEVIESAATKYNFQPHYPGPGVGGPCLPANAYYIIQDAEKVDYIPFMIRITREINDRMPNYVMELITKSLNFIGKSIRESKITVLGISYKANVKDIQISPAIKVINLLKSYHAQITVWDPYYINETLQDFTISSSIPAAFDNADCIVVLTDHKEIIHINFGDFPELLTKPVVLVDTRNIFDPKQLPTNFVYCGIGREIRKLS